MEHIRKIDFVYKNEKEEKKIGEAENISIHATLALEIRRKHDHCYSCLCQKISNKWYLDIADEEQVRVELSFPDDIYWNIDSIYEGIKNLEDSYKIAYGLRDVYDHLRGQI